MRLPPDPGPHEDALLRRDLHARLLSSRAPVLLLRAGPGWGKTTALRTMAAGRPSAWVDVRDEHAVPAPLLRSVVGALEGTWPDLPPDLAGLADQLSGPQAADGAAAEAIASKLAAALETAPRPAGRPLLVLDEVDRLPEGSGGAQLVGALLRTAPEGLQIALAARQAPAVELGAVAGAGGVEELTAAALRLDAEQVGRIAAQLLGRAGADLGPDLHELTGGWPAAAWLVAGALRDVDPAARAAVLRRSGHGTAAVAALLADQVLARLRPAAAEVMRLAAALPDVDPPLLADLGMDPEVLEDLTARGVLEGPDRDGGHRLVPIVAGVLGPADLPAGSRARVIEALRSRGRHAAAMGAALRWGADDVVADLLEQDGARLLAAGEVHLLARVDDVVPAEGRSRADEEVLGQALMVRGDWTGALRCLRRAAAGAEPLPVGLAWRLGLIHYLRGEVPAALEVYDAAAPPRPDDYESALLLAFEACARWVGGQLDAARQLARKALDAATRFGDPHSLSAVHTALAMVAAADGDHVAAERHFRDGLACAEQVGSTLQVVRLLANHASHLTDEGEHAAALADLTRADDLAELTGFAILRLLIASNRAEVHRRLGDLDVAEGDARHAVAIGRELGTGLVVHPELVLADIAHDRGDRERAAAGYAHVIAQAEGTGDVQALVPALSGAARVAGDLAEGRALAQRAVAEAVGTWALPARLARGWVAVRDGRHDEAAADARWVLHEARRQRARPAEGEAHELLAVLADDAADRIAHLQAARDVHRSTGAALAVVRTTAALVAVGADATPAEEVARHRRELTGRDAADAVTGLDLVLSDRLRSGATGGGRVQIRALGGFVVLRDGAPVDAAEWRSRKARDLLRVLVARRGARTSRTRLAELLWQGEDADRTANRLSAAISVCRGVLDPARALPADHHIASDPESVWLDTRHVDVDLERFHAAVRAATRQVAAGAAGAELALADAAAAYAGDLLGDEDEDWVVPAREEARVLHLRALRTLIGLATDRGDHDEAVRRSLRLLAEDPYDEDAYAELIGICTAAGRHGEARRHYRRYVAQMRRLGVPPIAFPGVSGLRDLV